MPDPARPAPSAFKVIVLGSALFAFISYWRVAAVVLCDLASTAFYIGGIVESSVGPAAPWFVLGVMAFSYAVRSMYIESCSMFVRGGVYRVVKEAMGGFMGKLSVSALLFDYVLTGPISAVSAGQYVVGLALDTLAVVRPEYAVADQATRDAVKRYGATGIAAAVIFYFFRQNLVGVRRSSDKAFKIMVATTAVVAVLLAWCGLTLALRGPANALPLAPDLSRKVEYQEVPTRDAVTGQDATRWATDPATNALLPARDEAGEPKAKANDITGRQEDPLGFAGDSALAGRLRDPARIHWLSLLGAVGVAFAFGHAILAMSGEETLAQVYREVAAPKMRNFKRAALIIFAYSLVMTGGISFLAVLLVPDDVRMKEYADNLVAGLTMNLVGPPLGLLVLHAAVVLVGFLILSGAANTAIIGSNGVLNRVAEDGVLPAWFLKPHPRHGTTYRTLYLILVLQLAAVAVSRGNVLLLGEAYAFGVVWSFVFKALAMIVLRFRRPGHREARVPLNVRLGGVELPLGLGLIFLILASAGVANLVSKEVATLSGLAFTGVFMLIFVATERYYGKPDAGHGEHVEQFNERSEAEVSPESLGLTKQRRVLAVVCAPDRLAGLEKLLAEADADATDIVIAGLTRCGSGAADDADRRLMTAVLDRCETLGKGATPVLVPAGDYEAAVARLARDLRVREVVVDAPEGAADPLGRLAAAWGDGPPLTLRLAQGEREERRELGGGEPRPAGAAG